MNSLPQTPSVEVLSSLYHGVQHGRAFLYMGQEEIEELVSDHENDESDDEDDESDNPLEILREAAEKLDELVEKVDSVLCSIADIATNRGEKEAFEAITYGRSKYPKVGNFQAEILGSLNSFFDNKDRGDEDYHVSVLINRLLYALHNCGY